MNGNIETWIAYNKIGDHLFYDTIIIIFSKELNKIYLFSDEIERLSNTDYLSIVCNLVHDLPIDFELARIKINVSAFDIPVETLIENLPADNNNGNIIVDTKIDARSGTDVTQ